MNIPLELPLKASEAAALADLIYRHVDGRPLREETRARLAGRVAALDLKSLHAFTGSLQADRVHPSAYYIAVDGLAADPPQPLLLYISPASAPSSAIFPGSMLIGRMRPGGGREIVVNAVPLSARDAAQVRAFAEQVDGALLPRPQGAQAAIAVDGTQPQLHLPAAFEVFRAILKSTGVNLAATVLPAPAAGFDNEHSSPEAFYTASLWAAIRAGWREGFSAMIADIPLRCESMQPAMAIVDRAAGCSTFGADASALLEVEADPRHPDPWPDNVVEERFEQVLTASERDWVRGEFARPFAGPSVTYQLSPGDIVRLAVKFTRGLKAAEALFDYIRGAKAAARLPRQFDFELSLSFAPTITTPQELLFCLNWFKARGRAMQLAAPNLGLNAPGGLERGARVSELAEVARLFGCILSIQPGGAQPAELVEQIGRATGGRVNYRVGPELQQHLMDVLAGEPSDSPWRGAGSRTDLDQLPAQLAVEVRRRDAEYLQRVAAQLRG